MIPKQYRLKHDKDFEILFQEGGFFHGTSVQAKIWNIDVEKYPRRKYTQDTVLFGFVVSKKIEKSAVKRNSIKRKMREALRLLLKERVLQGGYIVCFIATKQSHTTTVSEFSQEIEKILKKSAIIL